MICVRIESCQRKGRHLVADQSFAASATVLKQQPYAAVLYDDHVQFRCDYCYAVCENPQRCSRSKLARYCSREHQRAAWKAGYQQECAALVACAPKVPPPSVRLAARVLWRKAREDVATGVQDVKGCTFPEIQMLLHHWEHLDDDRKAVYAQMAALTRHFMQGALPHGQDADTFLPPTKEIALLIARFAANNHTICDDELRPVGVGIYPLGALFNHSCTPNCMQSFQGSTIMFRALRNISAGEECTISYVELAGTRQDRRRQLLRNYHFDIDDGVQAPPAPTHKHMLSELACLKSFGRCPTPPWPTDQHDHQLTAMVRCGGGESAQQAAALPGGMTVAVHAGVMIDDELQQHESADAPDRVEISHWGDWSVAVDETSSADTDAGIDYISSTASNLDQIHQLLQLADNRQASQSAKNTAAVVSMLQQALLLADGRPLQCAQSVPLRPSGTATFHRPQHSELTDTAAAQTAPCAALGTYHALRMRCNAALLKAAIDAGDCWDVALITARQLTPVYELIYPKVWPNLGLHYATLAKLEMFLEHPAHALEAANNALECIKVTDSDSSVIQDVLRVRYEAQAELQLQSGGGVL
eukprot:jgi/Chrzof1/12832/Cz07g08320.t1